MDKKKVEELGFLNGEIGKAKILKSSIEYEIEVLKSDKENKQKEIAIDLALKSSQISSLDRQKISRQSEVDNLTIELDSARKELLDSSRMIEDNKILISKFLADFSLRETRLKDSETNYQKEKDALTLSIMDVEKSKKEIENIKKTLKDREDSLNIQADIVSNHAKVLDIREQKTKTLEVENQKTFNLNATRAGEIEKEREQFNQDKQNFAIEKVNSQNRIDSYQDKINEIKEKQKVLDEEVKNIEKRDGISIIREQKSILKEEELKIREKRIALKEQQV